jgi:hypothetical protein
MNSTSSLQKKLKPVSQEKGRAFGPSLFHGGPLSCLRAEALNKREKLSMATHPFAGDLEGFREFLGGQILYHHGQFCLLLPTCF